MRQIERFYARNLLLSREMAINLQSFGDARDTSRRHVEITPRRMAKLFSP